MWLTLTISGGGLESVAETLCVCVHLLDPYQRVGTPQFHEVSQLAQGHPKVSSRVVDLHGSLTSSSLLLGAEVHRAVG